MDEQASFEPQAVLAGPRAGWNRLAVVVPAIALAAIAWAGASGARSDQTVAGVPDAAAAAPSIGGNAYPPSGAVRAPRYPAQVIGFDVKRLDDVQAHGLGRDAPIAIAGWYVATAITDCPPLAAFYRAGSLPEVRRDIAAVDSWAFCDRSGVLYASRPALDGRMPTDDLDNNQPAVLGLPAVAVKMTTGVVVPPQLEMIGAAATPVVVVAHFVPSGGGPWCGSSGCAQELVVDYLAWAAGV